MQFEMHVVVHPNVQGILMHLKSYTPRPKSPPIGFYQSLSQFQYGSFLSVDLYSENLNPHV